VNLKRTRVKICGITDLQDLRCAVAAGVDAVGFNTYPGSARYVDGDRLESLVRHTPAFVSTVALFVNPTSEAVNRLIRAVPVSLLQFHGDEEDAFCASFGLPFIKAIAVDATVDVAARAACFPSASALLLDTRVEGIRGGTGQRFDWTLVPRLDQPVIFAGGLSAANVAELIEAVHPYAVDVSSGVEASRGRKDPARMEAFMRAVRQANGGKDE
jgi:phosphoribosylanthranilate isomerase